MLIVLYAEPAAIAGKVAAISVLLTNASSSRVKYQRKGQGHGSTREYISSHIAEVTERNCQQQLNHHGASNILEKLIFHQRKRVKRCPASS